MNVCKVNNCISIFEYLILFLFLLLDPLHFYNKDIKICILSMCSNKILYMRYIFYQHRQMGDEMNSFKTVQRTIDR